MIPKPAKNTGLSRNVCYITEMKSTCQISVTFEQIKNPGGRSYLEHFNYNKILAVCSVLFLCSHVHINAELDIKGTSVQSVINSSSRTCKPRRADPKMALTPTVVLNN